MSDKSEITPMMHPNNPENTSNLIARRRATSERFNSIMDQTFTLLPIILKALIKSEKSPDAKSACFNINLNQGRKPYSRGSN
ncbi:MAG TPA: hypothetical protein GXX36_06670 [Clostridiaceae bacterium]|nr:hypothetical protein [Clostridiaceae bacterium]